MIGFSAIGIGATAAWEKLALLETEKSDPLEVVLYNAFDAKANAEMIQGVGYAWNAEIMVRGRRSRPVRKPIMRLVENVFESTPYSPFAKEKDARKPRAWKHTLRQYATEVLRESRARSK